MNDRKQKVLALGRTAEMLAWKDGWALKLFFDWFPAEGVRYEARLARAIHAAELPVPGVGEIVELDGRLGLPYERLYGPSMEAQLLSEPGRLAENAQILAELQATIHASGPVPGVPRQQEKLKRKIREARGLSQGQANKLIEALEALPDGDRLCHGDLHPANVVLTANGPVVIDWIDATLGNPLADVARSAIIMGGTEARAAQDDPALAGFVRQFLEAYEAYYFEKRPGGAAEYDAWWPIIAGARMDEGIEDLQDWLLAQVEKGLR